MPNEPNAAPTWTVAGVQTATGVDGRSRVEVLVRGRYTGSVNRGNGFDQLRVAVWDDGQEKDFKVVDIPLGGGNGLLDIGLVALGNLSDHRTVGRIFHCERTARRSRAIASVDEQAPRLYRHRNSTELLTT